MFAMLRGHILPPPTTGCPWLIHSLQRPHEGLPRDLGLPEQVSSSALAFAKA